MKWYHDVLMIVAGIVAAALWLHPRESVTTTQTVVVRDRNDSIRISIQAMTIEDLSANLTFEKKKRENTEAMLAGRNRTVKMLQAIIDTLQADTTAEVSVPTFTGDTVTTRGDSICAKFAFAPDPTFSFRIHMAPVDTFFIAHDSIITITHNIRIPTASPLAIAVGVTGGMSIGIGLAKDNHTATATGCILVGGLLIYQWLR